MRRPGSPLPRSRHTAELEWLRWEKKADIVSDGDRPQVNEDRERHQAEEIKARIGSVCLERPLHPPVDNSTFWELEDSFGKLAVEYDYHVGLLEQDERSGYLPA